MNEAVGLGSPSARHRAWTAACLFLVFLVVLSAFACQNPLDKVITAKISGVTDTALAALNVRVSTAAGSSADLPGLSPAFDATETGYSATADSLVTGVSVVAVPHDGDASLEWRMGDGSWHAFPSGTASSPASVAVGVNHLSLRVTSENGLENRIYTVDLTIPASGQGKPAIVVDPSPSTYAERFGHAVAMSDDGLTLAVGDVGGSYVHVFSRTSVDAVWAHSATLYPKNNSSTYYGTFGYALAISGDGKVVAAANTGGWVDLFSKGGDGTWTYTKTLSGSGSQYGCSVALSHDGSTVVVGDYYAYNSGSNLYPGAVYCYRASDWDNPVAIASPVANKEYWFGWAVAVSADGNTIAIGAPHYVSTADMAGAFYVYRYSAGAWTKVAEQPSPRAITSAEFGNSVAVSDDCGFILAGSQGMVPGIAGSSDRTGAAYLYSWDGNALSACGSVVVPSGATDQAKVGWSVALSADGLHAVIGAHQFSVSGITYSGAAFLYDVGTGGLSLSSSFFNPHPVSGDEFGYSVDIGSGNSPALAIGAEKIEPAGKADQGVVYIY